MKKTKMLSVRVDEDVLQQIDAYAAEQKYRSRSSVVNGILSNVMRFFDKNQLFKLTDLKYLDSENIKVAIRFQSVKSEAENSSNP